ncbi:MULTISPECIES: glycosyltransferase family 2 protein [Providencia]|uniref:glycosyltransferase family 2 protein n=1 Tax=Providencia TaxID=586 RepID=UPI0015E8CAEE|nr:glycosyltransferase family 2 protein [Providencia rettgeri]MCG5282391.1 glycosyltransferase [Providencia rettgeri]
MDNINFSVVITTKNRDFFLKRAINSIKLSTIKPTEIIIVNDGGTPPVVEKNLNIIVINNKYSHGANYSRNLGVQNTCCDFVFFLDDDDSVLPISFESRLKIMLKNNEIGMVFTGVHLVKDSNLEESARIVYPHNSSNYYNDLISKGNVIGSTSRVLVRKKYFDLAGGFDEKLKAYQDYDLWIRMSKICDIKSDNSATILYTVHTSNNQVSFDYKKYIHAGKYLISKYSYHVKKNGMSFKSNIYLRIALSASKSSFMTKIKYSFMSFYYRPNIKSIILILIPSRILRKIKLFV